MRMLTSILAMLIFSTTVPAGEWSGLVVAVIDSDTLSVMRDGKPVKIRLWGIDCPESRQDFGTAARHFLGDLAHERTATVHERDRDRYGRLVAIVSVDDANVNQELITAGLAWVYRQYCREPERTDWLAREAEAQAARLGLWSHPDPVPPWTWRRNRRAVADSSPSQLSKPEATAGEPPFKGNTRSRVFHVPACSAYSSSNCVRVFPRFQDAQQEGYRPCARCRPQLRALPAEPYPVALPGR